ncbi:MAG: endolytic transglycosylase MltG [Betaproteobacteria bacterium]
MFKLIKLLFVIAVLLVFTVGGVFFWLVSSPLELKVEQVDFHIPPGSSLRASAKEISSSGVLVDPLLLIALAKAMRVESTIKAGSYEIKRGITLLELLNKLTRGDVTQTDIAFIEGWTFRQWRERLNTHPELRHDTRDLSDQEIMRLIGAPEVLPEGLFFPDTYLFSKQSRDVDVLARAYRTMQRHLVREWENREAGLPYKDIQQALVMASIIEKETGRDQDRPMVAAVFVNRLRQGMLLQTDPTVIYGLGEGFDGNLRKRDLLTDTPYNTYTRAGLPPTPIATPGLASLHAALHPARSQAVYFVARGDGSSQFSRTLDEHNQAVNRYQRGGK